MALDGFIGGETDQVVILRAGLIHGSQLTVLNFSFDDAMGGNFRWTGKENFVDRMSQMVKGAQTGAIQKDADFGFNDDTGFLEGQEGLFVDELVPKGRGFDLLQLMLPLMEGVFIKIRFGEGVIFKVNLISNETLLEFFPSEAVFFQIPNVSKFSKEEAGVYPGEVKFFCQQCGGSRLAGSRPFARDDDREIIVCHGGIIPISR